MFSAITRFFSSFSKKEISHSWPAFQNFLTGNDGQEATWSYQDRVAKGYMGTDIVFSAVDIVASAFASVKLCAATVDSQGEVTKLGRDHQLNRLLAKPNMFQNQSEWLYAVAAFRMLGGTGYTLMDTGDPADFTKPVHLWPLAPPATQLVCEQNVMYWQFHPQESGCMKWAFRRLPIDIDGTSNIVDWKAFDPTSITKGMSPLKPADLASDIYRYGNIWNRTYFKHGSRPSQGLVSDTKDANGNPVFMDEDQRDLLKKELNEVYSGLASGNGKPILLEHIQPVELSANPKDADFIESHKQVAADVARTAGVPPVLLNQGEGTTYENMAQAKLSMWDDTIIPLVNSHAEELTEDLASRWGDNFVIVPDFSDVSALEPRRETAWKRAEESSFLTVNEKRELVGMDAIPGGDIVLVDSSKLPVEVVSTLGINGVDE